MHQTEKNKILKNKWGIGLRAPHLDFFCEQDKLDSIDWLEVHPENFLYDYERREKLLRISEKYPISFHCVTLSLGSEEKVSKKHLQAMKHLVHEVKPFLISDHLSWNRFDGKSYLDLFPIPLNKGALSIVAQNIQFIQDELGRRLLIENLSTYINCKESTIPEYEALNWLTSKTGCGVLVDVNNLYIQSFNHKISIDTYINGLNWESAGELHIAGHDYSQNKQFIIDTHGGKVSSEVLFYTKLIIQKINRPIEILFEQDQNLPTIKELLNCFQSIQDKIKAP
jgi:uncharacterized protein